MYDISPEPEDEEEVWTDKPNRAMKRRFAKVVRRAMRNRPKLTHPIKIEAAVNRQMWKIERDERRRARSQEDRRDDA